MRNTDYTTPTEDRIIVDREELKQTITDTLTNLGGLEDGTLAKVEAIPNSVAIRDSYGRLKVTNALNGKTNDKDDYVINVGLLNETLTNLKATLMTTYYTKEETVDVVTKLIDELVAQLGELDADSILEATKRIDDHIAVTEYPHGATSRLVPGSIPYRDSYGQFEVGEPQQDNHVARLGTIKAYLAGIDVEFLRNIEVELKKIEDILMKSLILWETVDSNLLKGDVYE